MAESVWLSHVSYGASVLSEHGRRMKRSEVNALLRCALAILLVVLVCLSVGQNEAFALQRQSSRRKRSFLSPQELTGHLKSVQSSNHLLFLVEQNKGVLNEHHISTALRWLAKDANETEVLSEDPGFLTLLGRTSELVTTFRAQALSNVLWSLAKVDHHPGDEFLQDVISASWRQIPRWKLRDLVNSLWACARLEYHPGTDFLDSAVKKSQSSLSQSDPTDLSNLLWSFARLRFHPGDQFVQAVLEESASKMTEFSPIDLANLMWACAHLNPSFKLQKSIFQPLLAGAESKLSRFEPQTLASLLSSCSKLGLRPSFLLQALPMRPDRELAALGPRGLSFILWLYGMMGYNPGEDFLERVLEKLSRTVPAFGYCGSQGLSGVLWVCARFNYLPGESHMAALLARALQEMPGFSPAQLTRLVWALSKLEHRPSDNFLKAWLQEVIAKEASFERHELLLIQKASIHLNFTAGVEVTEEFLSLRFDLKDD